MVVGHLEKSQTKPSIDALRFLVSAVQLISSYDNIILPVVLLHLLAL